LELRSWLGLQEKLFASLQLQVYWLALANFSENLHRVELVLILDGKTRTVQCKQYFWSFHPIVVKPS
jgi:hypothetical protein